MASGVFLFGLFLSALPGLPSVRSRGVKAQDTWLRQPQEYLLVLIGEDLCLECWVPHNLPAGAVKWYLGEGPQRKLIYGDNDSSENDKRIKRSFPGSNMDFTLIIHNVTLEDAGTYYCVKEKKSTGQSEEWLKGRGTLVVVTGSQRQPIFSLWMGLFLNKVAMAIFLLSLFQIKERGCSVAKLFSRSSQEVRQAESST